MKPLRAVTFFFKVMLLVVLFAFVWIWGGVLYLLKGKQEPNKEKTLWTGDPFGSSIKHVEAIS